MPPTSTSDTRDLPWTDAPGDTLRLPLSVEDTTTVNQARAVVRGALGILGAGSGAIDDAERSVAELVSNAARHARPPVELRLRRHDGTVVIAVADGSDRMPVWPATAVPDPDTLLAGGVDPDQVIERLPTFGRGLGIVQQLSGGRCGAYLARTGTGSPGKAVWFCHPLPGTAA